MSIRSRLQSPFHVPTENPNLVPLPPRGNVVHMPGRFQNVNISNEAQARTQVSQVPVTRIPGGVVPEQHVAIVETVPVVPATQGSVVTSITE